MCLLEWPNNVVSDAEGQPVTLTVPTSRVSLFPTRRTRCAGSEPPLQASRGRVQARNAADAIPAAPNTMHITMI